MKTLLLALTTTLVTTLSAVAFAENDGLTSGYGDASFYGGYSSSPAPAPVPTPVPDAGPNHLKTCVSPEGTHYYVYSTVLRVHDVKTAKVLPVATLTLRPDGTLASIDGKYKVYLSSNILLIDNSVVFYCR